MSKPSNTAGVQELIDLLSEEGVAEGQRQAEEIIQEAQHRVTEMLDAARQQAAEIIENAREEASHFQVAGEEALRVAARDCARDFGSRIHNGWRNRLQQLVCTQLQDPNLLKQMILQLAGQVADEAGEQGVTVYLPAEAITEQAASEQLKASDPDGLTQFVQGLIGDDLREGFRVDLGTQQAGLTVRMSDQQVEIDLTEGAIAELLGRHLLPRYRAIMRHAGGDSTASPGETSGD